MKAYFQKFMQVAIITCGILTFPLFTHAATPDLVVSDITIYPITPTPGSSAHVFVQIRNIGDPVPNLLFTTRLRIDAGSDGSWDVLPKELPTGGGSAAPNEFQAVWSEPWVIPPGTHTYEICADSGNVVSESNENNNCAQMKVTTLSASAAENVPPDLLGMVSYGGMSPGKTAHFDLFVEDRGGKFEGNFTNSLKIDTGNDGTWDTVFPDFTLNAIASLSKTAPMTIPWTAALGTHRYQYCVDIQNDVTESNEKNNCNISTFTVVQSRYNPDLVPKVHAGMLDIALIGSGYSDPATFRSDAERLTSHLLTMEPFKSKASLIKFHTYDTPKDFGCGKDVSGARNTAEPACSCANSMLAEEALLITNIPYDKYMILASGVSGGHATQNGDWGIVGMASPFQERTFAHELAHTLGLLDEYVYNAPERQTGGNISGVVNDACNGNCCFSAKCTDWQGVPGAQCIMGCSNADWYRSSDNSIMNDTDTAPEFNAVSQRLLAKKIDAYTIDTTPPNVTMKDPNWSNMDIKRRLGKIPLIANVSDDQGIARVDFLIDGVLAAAVHEIPASSSLTSPQFYPPEVFVEWDISNIATGTVHTISARAYDLAGNMTMSPSITTTVGGTVAKSVNYFPPSPTPPVLTTPHVLHIPQTISTTTTGSSATTYGTNTSSMFSGLRRDLRRGMSGDDVAHVQMYLAQFPDIYPGGTITGYFGALTKEAVKKFQRREGIPDTGFIGPMTRARLNTLNGATM